MPEINLLLERAQLLLQQGRVNDAEKNIKDVLQQDPENDEALSLLAKCCYERNDYDQGIEIIQRAIGLDPENSYYFYLLAFGYYRKDYGFAAIDNLNKAISLNPYSAEYYGMLAFVLLEEKEFEKALEKANEGLAIEPENVTCLNARARALNKLKRTDDAIATMQDALSQDPDNEFTHTTIGWNLLEKGKNREANKHFREALRIDPDHEGARAGLKESLKSNLPPYKWLLQYSFWVNDKGKKFQVALPIALYISFRILISIFKSNDSTAGLAWILVSIYLLIIVTSWTINSIANFILLFHRDGKYSLTNTERWAAITVVSSLAAGIGVMALAEFSGITSGTAYEKNLFLMGMVILSLALPLGNIEYPVTLNGNNKREWFSLAVIATGIVCCLAYLVLPAYSFPIFLIYGIAFIIYNWSGLAK